MFIIKTTTEVVVSLSKKSKLVFHRPEKHRKNGYFTSTVLDFFLKKRFIDKLKQAQKHKSEPVFL